MIKKFFTNSLLLLNIAAVGLLLLSKGSCYISPQKIWWIGFAGMAFPVFLIANIFFVFLWALVKPWFTLFSLITIALVWPEIKSGIAFGAEQEIVPDSALTLMTYNVKNFDLYNWSNNKETRNNIMRLIGKHNPDVLCIQEFYSQDAGEFQNDAYIRDSLGYKYSYFNKKFTKSRKNRKGGTFNVHWGIAIYSKHKIVQSGEIRFDNKLSNNCQWADIAVGEKFFRVYNMHLQSIHLEYNDYNTIEDIEENQKTSWVKVKTILLKIHQAFRDRPAQIAQVKKSAGKSPYPYIFCGDFNDLPVSFTYKQMSENMSDAFLEKGAGIGGTFHNSLKLLRIDYTFFSNQFRVYDFEKSHEEFSDHYPLIVKFGWKE